MQKAVGTQATAVRSQSYYLDVTPPGCDKGTFVQAMARRLGISTGAVATIGDMQNDLAMFKAAASRSRWATPPTTSRAKRPMSRPRTRRKVLPGRSR